MASLPWDRLGQATSVLQVTGMDAMGLVSMIVQAAHTARRNRELCQQLAQHAKMIKGLLPQLQIPELQCHLQIREPLAKINEALLRAFTLVRSCGDELKTTSRVYHFFTGSDMADKLQKTQEEIDRYINLIPTITTIAILLGRATYQEEAQDDAPNDLTPAAQRPPLSLEEVPRLLAGEELPPTRTIAGNLVSQPVVAEVQQRSDPSSFAFAQLEASTNHFSPAAEIGKGRFGKVYRGVLPDGSVVAIKRYERLPRMDENFRWRLDLFSSRIRHRHLVGLLGYCSNQDGEWLFVYDYMKYGSLRDHLTCDAPSPVASSWKLRFRILLDASRGIEYLHSYAGAPVVHGNIKPSNIMLDGGWTARVSDFRLSLIQPEPEPEPEPEHWPEQPVMDLEDDLAYVEASVTNDIRSFGTLMLRLLIGRRFYRGELDDINFLVPSERDRRASLSNWEEEKAVDLVARTAVRCINDSGNVAMPEIVTILERAVSLCEGGA
ncbi:hypothetical protein ACP4OV_029215 [Aristida adscensionis]